MDDLPKDTDQPEPAHLRFLRRLVTILTATMILGMVVVVTLLVLRINQSAPMAVLPEQITLPDGTQPIAVTTGQGWYAVVTQDNRILVFGRDGDLRQTVDIAPE